MGRAVWLWTWGHGESWFGVGHESTGILQNSNSIFLDYISTSRITGSNGKNSTLILRNLCFLFNKPGYVLASCTWIPISVCLGQHCSLFLSGNSDHSRCQVYFIVTVKKYLFILLFIYVYTCVSLCVPCLVQVNGEAIGRGVTGCCEPSDVDSEKWVQALWKSSKYFPMPGHFSSSHCIICVSLINTVEHVLMCPVATYMPFEYWLLADIWIICFPAF